MLILDAADVRRALAMPVAIDAMKRAFAALSDGRAVVPERTHIAIRPHDGTSLVMPAFVDGEDGQALAVKVVSLFDHNRERGLARLQAAVLVLEPDTGRPAALLEGASLTAIRTGAASGAATDLMAPPGASTAALLGAGVQGRTQLEAVCTVRRIGRARVYDPCGEAAEKLVAEMAGRGPVPADLRAVASAREALAGADVVCLATTSRVPVFGDADLKAGAHVNAIGSYEPGVVEVPPETVARAWVVVDSREAALAEAGDLIQPIRAGRISADHVRGELGDVVLGRCPPRGEPGQVTLFKAVGVAVQDAVAARAALERARQEGLGRRVDW